MKIDKCASCGSHMKFDPFTHNLICASCGGTVNVNLSLDLVSHSMDLNTLTKKVQQQDNDYNAEIRCQTCGAIQTSSGHNISDKCGYCGASLFVVESSQMPDGCVLFNIDKELAVTKFKEGIVKKKFLPSAFKNNPPMDDIEAVYFPAFMFCTEGKCYYKAVLEEKDDDDGVYRTRRVSDYLSFHEDTIIEGSRYLTQNNFNEIMPYDLNQLYKFDKKFIIGYSVEYYNRNFEDAGVLAKQIVSSRIRNMISSDIRRVGETIKDIDMDIKYSSAMYNYILLPVYKIKYKYGKKEYSAFVNGQTGNVGGQVPRSGGKIFLLVISILLLVGLGVFAFTNSGILDFITKFFK